MNIIKKSISYYNYFCFAKIKKSEWGKGIPSGSCPENTGSNPVSDIKNFKAP